MDTYSVVIPAYVPRYNNARNEIRKYERDEIVEELVRYYFGRARNRPSNENYGIGCWFKDRRVAVRIPLGFAAQGLEIIQIDAR